MIVCKKYIVFVFIIIGTYISRAQKDPVLVLDVSVPTYTSFKPIPGEKYVVSGWLKEDRPQQVVSYTSSGIIIDFGPNQLFNDDQIPIEGDADYTFYPSGDIIDGWQRVIGIFEIPQDAVAIKIGLKGVGFGIDTYFDDIRIYPFNGNMKSFVYDNDTQRLMAELDENNYATYYEYDQEGGLVRVKKETEKGVYTIQETRSGNSKLTTQQ
ncbi:hypothetical protein [uncultured Aquimarina sp.]|uniref:hypothetical protein n=1 Tax=uncultured Aquimarina sp. TaxID=575652 RepID=UPI0026334CEF|nr:hypothetical protein [uncultured Aquimarina sp.]